MLLPTRMTPALPIGFMRDAVGLVMGVATTLNDRKRAVIDWTSSGSINLGTANSAMWGTSGAVG
jgi:hypothetical protein